MRRTVHPPGGRRRGVGRRGFLPLTSAGLRRRLGAALAVGLVASGLAVAGLTAAPSPPASAAPALDCGSVYALQGVDPRNIWNVNTANGNLTSTGTFAIGASATSSLNGLGITDDGSAVYGVLPANSGTGRTVYRHLRSTEATAALGAGVAGAGVTHGAVNPVNNFYYYGGLSNPANGTATLSVYGFNTATNTSIGLVAQGAVPAGGANGDWAFDQLGRLYVTGGSGNNNATNTNVLSAVNEQIPATAVASPVALTGTQLSSITTPAGQAINGIAFAGSGLIYLASQQQLFEVRPNTGAVLNTRTLSTAGSVDLASCARPSTIVVQKNFSQGRVDSTDQATVTVSGDNLGTGNTSGTTTGTETGLQNQSAAEFAGPVFGTSGTTYTISESGSGTRTASSTQAGYTRAWSCVNASNNDAVVASGTGASGSFTMPASGATGASVVCTFTNAAQVARLTLDKTAGTPTGSTPGSTITYGFAVTNTGTVPLTGLTVTDPKVGTITCGSGSLAVGATRTCTPVSYAITQDDISAGRVDNTATATGTASGLPSARGTDSVSTTITQNPSLQLTKRAGAPSDANGNGLVDTGDRIGYTFAVTNDGNVPITGLAINDAKVGATTCNVTSLAVGASTTCATTTAYTITAADQSAGAVNNSATASGTGPQGGTVTSNRSTTSTPVTAPSPQLTLVKAAGTPTDVNGSTITDAGDTIGYSFRVTNSGNVAITGLAINDAKVGATSCPVTSLAVGAATTCTTTSPYVVSAADQTNGAVSNSATARAAVTGGGTVTSNTSTTRTAVTTPSPSLAITKRAATPVDVNSSGITDTGDTIRYSFTVTNTGNVPVRAVVIDDPLLTRSSPAITTTCASTTLAPGASTECTASRAYAVTDDDEVAGRVVNSASATGTNPDAGTVRSATSSVTTPVTQARPSLGVVKRTGQITDANGSGLTDTGDTIAYSFTITNTGNVPIRDVVIVDAKIPTSDITCSAAGGGTGSPSRLPAGEVLTCTTVTPYVVTAAEEQAGVVANTARASGADPDGATTTSDPSTTQVPTTAQSAVLTLTKSAAPAADLNESGTIDAGDTIRYSFLVTNDGNVPVQSLSIIDARAGPVDSITCGSTTLAVGASTTCAPTSPYVITAADETDGRVVNTATAQGRAPRGEPNLVTSNRSSTTTGPVVAPAPAVTIDKRVLAVADRNGSGLTDAGDRITYDVVVTNTGNVPLTGVTVTDPQFPAAGDISCPRTRLAAGETMTCTAVTYTVSAADEAAGSAGGTATVRGTGPGPRNQAVSATDATSTPVTRPDPRLSLVKRAAAPVDVNGSGLTDAGDTIQYSFTVTNAGNVPVASVTVVDPLLGDRPTPIDITCEVTRLVPGASTSCSAGRPYPITEADESRGEVVNRASATGRDPDDRVVSSAEDVVRTPVSTPNPATTLAKSAATPVDRNDNGVTDAGDTIAYSFTFTNTGDVPLRGFTVSDPKVGRVDCPAATVAPGQTEVCRAASLYAVTAQDVASGSVLNTATGSALDPDGVRVGAGGNATTSTPAVAPDGTLRFEKSAGEPVDVNGSGIVDAGDTIAFSFLVTNVGNVPVDLLRIEDPQVGTVSCPATTLAPGTSTTCSTTTPVVLGQEDEQRGGYANRARAVAQVRGGGTTESPFDETSTAVATPAPSLRLEKTAGTPVDVNGSTITDAGDTIAYTFTITNTGNVPVTGLEIDDARLTGIACEATTLQPGGPAAPGSSTTCTADPYVVTEADEVAVGVVNVATAAGVDPDGGAVESDEATTTTPTTVPAPALTIDKRVADVTDGDGDDLTDVGDQITYDYTVTNTGNVPLDGVTVDDDLLASQDPAITVTCEADTLPPGGSTECSSDAPYTITEADAAAGVVTNTATALGYSPDADPDAEPDAEPDVASDPDTARVGVTAEARVLTLTKTAGTPVDVNGSGLTDAGDTVAFTFTVVNDGNVAITDIAIDDPPLGGVPVTCLATDLAPGERTTCSTTDAAPYVITAADERAGRFVNTATAVGRGPGGAETTSNQAQATITPVTAGAPSLSIEKRAAAPVDVNDSGITDAGDTITYSFRVTNTGNVPLTGIVVDDAKVGEVSCPTPRLAPGGVETCTAAAYVVTTGEEVGPGGTSPGAVLNRASVSATDPDGDEVTAESNQTSTPTERPAPSLALDKRLVGTVDGNASGLLDAGDTIRYRFEVTNDGNVPIRVLQVVDPTVGTVSCENVTIPPGAGFTCAPVVDYRVTVADEERGSVLNTAFARGVDPDDDGVRSNDDSTTIDIDTPRPEVEVTKSAVTTDRNRSGLVDAGDLVTYTFTVTNTGDVPVTGARIIDPLVAGGSCSPADLPAPSPGEPRPSTTCTATETYVVTEADEAAGEIVNTATARVRDPDDEIVDSRPASATTTVGSPAPALEIEKTAAEPVDVNGSGLVDAGDTIAYTFTVTNTGNVPVTGVVVDDPLLAGLTPPIAISCAATELAAAGAAGAGDMTTCRAQGGYVITEADERSGEVLNTARAVAVDPDAGAVTSEADRVRTPVVTPAPSLSLEKSASVADRNGSGLTDAGDEVTYSFAVTNTGDVPLDAVAIDDDLLAAQDPPITVTCPAGVLAVDGPALTCTADAAYVVTAADVAAGLLSNTATATAEDPDGLEVASDPDTVREPTTAQSPVLTLDKEAGTPLDVNGSGITDAGDTIAYTFTVTNSGNVPVGAIAIDDPLLASQTDPAVTITCDDVRLLPAASTLCRTAADAPYEITAADEVAGRVLNEATATGLDPDDGDVTSNEDTVTTTVTRQAPLLGLEKRAAVPVDVNDSGLVDAGDTISYTFTVTNVGNVPVSGVQVSDPTAGAVTCDVTDLAVGASTECSAADYSVTEADESAGAVVNAASALAVDPDGDGVASPEQRVTTEVDMPTVALSFTKTAGVPVDVNDSGTTDAGDTIAYSFTVTNDGNVPVVGVGVDDDLLAGLDPAVDVSCDETRLAPGATTGCTADAYTITADDEAAGEVVNTASAVAADPDDEPVASDEASTTTPVTVTDPVLTIDKTADVIDVNGSGNVDAGDEIAYTFTVANTGNVTLRRVEVVDELLAGLTPPITVTCDDGRLLAGQSTTCAADAPYVVTEADEATGAVDNSAFAQGLAPSTPPGGEPETSEPDETTTDVLAPDPALVVTKTAGDPVDVNGSGLVDAGDTIAYTFTITNDGNVPVSGVGVADDLLAELDPAIGVSCEETFLAPGAVTGCTADRPYVITTADEDAGSVDNTASAVGVDPDGDGVSSAEQSTSTPVDDPAPAVSLTKTAEVADVNSSGLSDAGDEIAYTFTVSNDGDVPLSDLVVDDELLAGLVPAITVTCEVTDLPVGADTTCAADAPYVVTSADELAGSVDNQALARTLDPDGDAVDSAVAGTTTPTAVPDPGLAVDKTVAPAGVVDVNGNDVTDAGDTVRFAFTVTNTGTVPVADLAITDDLLARAVPAITVECGEGPLAPGDERDCTASAAYTITEADEAARVVRNTATATGVDPDGDGVVSDPDTVNVPVTDEAAVLTLTKTAAAPVDVNRSGLTDAGDTIAYTFTVTNDGNVRVGRIAIDDPMLDSASPAVDVRCRVTALAPGGSTTCSAATSYVVTETDERAGEVVNRATATGSSPTGRGVESNPTSARTAPVTVPAPALRLTKTAAAPVDVNRSGLVDAGDTIAYTFRVANAGNVPVSDVTVDDDLLATLDPAIGVTCDVTTLAPGRATSCAADAPYVVTQADEAAGSVDNTASAEGSDPDGGEVTSPGSSTSTPVQQPVVALRIEKAAGEPVDVNGSGLVDAGDEIDYTFTVTNTGTVPVSGVAVVDPLLDAQEPPITVTCDAATLAPGARETCSADAPYVVNGVDELAGEVVNVARAVGADPDGEATTSVGDSTTTDVGLPAPSLSIDKAAEVVDTDGGGTTDEGDEIDYSFTVINTGNVPVTGLEVRDPLLAGLDPAITITCEATDLAVDEETTCVADAPYVISADDEDDELVRNTATAEGSDPDGGDVVSDPDATNTPTSPTAAVLTLDKAVSELLDSNGSGITDAGDEIRYTFTVTNDGNVRVRGVAIDDPALSGAAPPVGVSCGRAILPVGTSTTCTSGLYTVTAADETAGEVLNAATATGRDPEAGPVRSNEDTVRTPVTVPDRTLTTVKTADAPVDVNGSGLIDAGDEITYRFTVTNDGNVPVTVLRVDDPLLAGQADPVTAVCSPTTLAPGSSSRCVADGPYVVTAQDVASGEVVNSAIATAIDPDGDPVTSPPASTTVEVDSPAPALRIEKAARAVDTNGSGLSDANDEIRYSFTVTNTGNVPVRAIGVQDELLGATGVTCDAGLLQPGDTTACAADAPYVITETDEVAGEVVNTASATGLDPDGRDVVSEEDSTRTPVATPSPAITMVKNAGAARDVNRSGLVDAGDQVDYSFDVTNTGDVPVFLVAIEDRLLEGSAIAVQCAERTLPPGDTTTCVAAAPYVITEADQTAGEVVNTATAIARDPDGEGLESRQSTTTTRVAVPTPGLEITKAEAVSDVDGDGVVDEGDEIAYTFTVENVGDVPVDGVLVDDPLLAAVGIGVTCDVTNLAPGDATSCAADAPYVITADDVSAGEVLNAATAAGADPDGEGVGSNEARAQTPTDVASPSLSLVKTATVTDVNANGVTDAGDEIDYSFTVENVGNALLTVIAVQDSSLREQQIGVTCLVRDLAPGEVTTCTSDGPYVVGSDDEVAGAVVNTAYATGVLGQGGGPTESPADTVDTPVVDTVVPPDPRPGLSLDKRAEAPTDVDGDGRIGAGDRIDYSFTVTNTGDVVLTDIAVDDPLVEVTCAVTTLAPAARTECEASYRITAADVAAGEVVNRATATGSGPAGEEVASAPDQAVSDLAVDADPDGPAPPDPDDPAPPDSDDPAPTDPPDAAPTQPDGILPNTGGPAVLLVLLGLLLTGAGVLVIRRSRRRRTTP